MRSTLILARIPLHSEHSANTSHRLDHGSHAFQALIICIHLSHDRRPDAIFQTRYPPTSIHSPYLSKCFLELQVRVCISLVQAQSTPARHRHAPTTNSPKRSHTVNAGYRPVKSAPIWSNPPSPLGRVVMDETGSLKQLGARSRPAPSD